MSFKDKFEFFKNFLNEICVANCWHGFNQMFKKNWMNKKLGNESFPNTPKKEKNFP